MMWCRTELLQSFLMLGHPVALVLGKAVPGLMFLKLNHHPVPGDLGDNGGRRYAQTPTVSLYQCLSGLLQTSGHIAAIYQNISWYQGETVYSADHG